MLKTVETCSPSHSVTDFWKKAKFSSVIVHYEELRVSSYITKMAWPFLKVYNFITDIPGSPERIPWCESLTTSRALGAYFNFLLLTFRPQQSPCLFISLLVSIFLTRFLSIFIFPILFWRYNDKNISAYGGEGETIPERKRSWFPVAVENCMTASAFVYMSDLECKLNEQSFARSLFATN